MLQFGYTASKSGFLTLRAFAVDEDEEESGTTFVTAAQPLRSPVTQNGMLLRRLQQPGQSSSSSSAKASSRMAMKRFMMMKKPMMRAGMK